MNTITAKAQEFAPLAGRVMMSAIFLLSGFSKIGQYQATQGYMEAMGVPGGLLPLVIATEILGGLAIVLGFQTRLAAFALAGFSLLTAAFFHSNLADQAQFINFFKNVAMAGGFLFLVGFGGGKFSIDKLLARNQATR